MRRVQIYLDEQLDDALASAAARRGISKAALIREFLAEHMPAHDKDRRARDEMVGWIKDELPDAGTVDEIVYGR